VRNYVYYFLRAGYLLRAGVFIFQGKSSRIASNLSTIKDNKIESEIKESKWFFWY